MTYWSVMTAWMIVGLLTVWLLKRAGLVQPEASYAGLFVLVLFGPIIAAAAVIAGLRHR